MLGDQNTKIYEAKDKIVEVWAAARVIMQRYGHTRKFANRIVALAIKQEKNFRDYQLIEFLEKDPIRKVLSYKSKINPSTFSKVCERADSGIFKDIYDWIVRDRLEGKQIHLPAHSK